MFLRVGGMTAVIDGLGGLVANALHPRPPERTEELLTLGGVNAALDHHSLWRSSRRSVDSGSGCLVS
jgi:hypothetical protein